MFKRLIRSPAFRQRTTWVVAAVLVLPFIIFFSASTPLSGPRADEAGRLFGKSVSWDTFRQQRVWLGRQLPEELDLPESALTQATWERLMLLEEAKRRRVRVESRRVAALIRDTPAFQVEGRFDPERYRQFLKATGTTPQRFEALLRDDLLLQHLFDEVKAAVEVSEEALREAYRTRHEKATIALLTWDAAERAPAIAQELTEEALKAYYDAHQEEFRDPAQITFDYLAQTREELAGRLTLTDQELKEYFEARKDEFPSEGDTPPTFEAARNQIQSRLADARLRRRLNHLAADLDLGLEDGKTLEALGASLELALRSFGPIRVGDLWASGAPEPAVLQEAFKLQAGRVSGVIETGTGV
jgi:peptidyl-prolyl cis-trans isomerase D